MSGEPPIGLLLSGLLAVLVLGFYLLIVLAVITAVFLVAEAVKWLLGKVFPRKPQREESF